MEDVTKVYPNGIEALKGISVEIEEGEFIYVIGPSGAGKSTFIKLMYREEKATSGKVLVNNTDLISIKNKHIPLLRRNIGCIFQDFKLLPKLTVYENVAFVLEVTDTPKKEIKLRVDSVLEKVGLSDKSGMYPHEISGGQQQRVSIARALVNNPKIIIADEPTGNLDPDTGEEIFNLLSNINNSGTTVIMTTHNRELVNTHTNRVIAIEDGIIVSDEKKGSYLYE